MIFLCKKCKKAFRKVRRLAVHSLLMGRRCLTSTVQRRQDMTLYEESDEFCPHCEYLILSCSEGSSDLTVFVDTLVPPHSHIPLSSPPH